MTTISPSTKIKVCGMTRFEDVRLAVELGAWAIGFILWPGSKRYIDPASAAEIVRDLKKSGFLPKKIVGVFVNASRKEIDEAYETIGLTTVQLHGDESADFCNVLPYETFVACRLKSKEDLKKYASYECDAFLVDASVSGQYGGTGHLADWGLANAMKTYGPLILSGGINPQNIREAIAEVTPFALDLASGVEERPGIKSDALLKELFRDL